MEVKVSQMPLSSAWRLVFVLAAMPVVRRRASVKFATWHIHYTNPPSDNFTAKFLKGKVSHLAVPPQLGPCIYV